MSKKGLLGILILILGLFAGLILIKRSQEFRERAQEDDESTYTVCHKTNFVDKPWEEIEVVGAEALQYHLSIGDKLGPCDFSLTPTLWPSNFQTNLTPTEIPELLSPTPIPSPTPTLTKIQKLEELLFLRVPGKVNFKISFQSVDTERPDQIVKITLVTSNGKEVLFNNVLVKSGSEGKFLGTLDNVKPGVYDVLIKGSSHLQRKFENETIYADGEMKNWSQEPLLAGDFNSDNLLNLSDIANLLGFYIEEENIIDKDSILYDVNFDGVVSLADLEAVLTNYNALEVYGEE